MSIVNRAIEKLKEAQAVAATSIPGVAAMDVAATATTAALPVRQLAGPVISVERDLWQAAGLMGAGEEALRCAAQCRSIKQEILRHFTQSEKALGNTGRTILVTSTLSGDGKSFISANLALSLANERDLETVLIDGDVAMRQLTRTLGLEGCTGLLDVLRDRTLPLSSALYRTSNQNLLVMPAGNWAEDASDLLAGTHVKTLVRDLQSGNGRRILLFDSSPVLLTPDSRVLAEHANQILLVVRAAVSLQRDVKAAAATLSSEGRRLALIFNQITPPDFLDSLIGHRHADGYGYGYGSAGGYYPTTSTQGHHDEK